MKHPSSMGIVLVAALAVAVGGIGLLARAHRGDGERQAAEGIAADLTRRVEAAERGRAALESRVDSLEARFDALGRPVPSAGGAEEKEGSSSPVAAEASRVDDAASPGTGGDGSAPAHPAADLERVLGALLDPSRSSSRRQEAWAEAAKLGLIDLVLAVFEHRAEEDPGNARAQADLGTAYLQKLNAVSEMEKGSWAVRADRAFDAALAIDPTHWEARFTKALALSYWPAITGKQPESIRQFETLIAQQESAAARPEHARSYLFLGNLYLGQGKGEKALEVWRRGASLFPADRELASRLEGAEPGE